MSKFVDFVHVPSDRMTGVLGLCHIRNNAILLPPPSPATNPDTVQCTHMTCICRNKAMNTSNSLMRGSRSTLSRRHDKPWRISVQPSDQKTPTSGLRIFLSQRQLMYFRECVFQFYKVVLQQTVFEERYLWRFKKARNMIILPHPWNASSSIHVHDGLDMQPFPDPFILHIL